MKYIRLQSCDNKEFAVNMERLLSCSKFFKDMFSYTSKNDELIKLPIEASILEIIIEWINYEEEDAPGLIRSDKYDSKFILVDQPTICKLIKATAYLQIRQLHDLSCQAVAELFKGKSPEKIRRTFNIVNDIPGES